MRLLGMMFVCTALLHATGVETDGTTQTTLDHAANGVEIVNIANPNAQGLSHNRYKQFNVSKQGLILNNAKSTTVKTELGGYIYGNSHLSNSAKVILNEVTSSAGTQLSGYTEVAGRRADVVIANPNGITVNGAGFINTANMILATGRPVILNGKIDSYGLGNNAIAIEGAGLDATRTDSALLYTKLLKLNAGIYANKLHLRFGSLDTSALGGMYANAITMIGTDKGVGVNLPPEVLASNGDISITADGDIVLQKVSASRDVTLRSTGKVTTKAHLTSGHDTHIKAKAFTNDSLVNTGNILNISADMLTNNKTLFSAQSIELYIAHVLKNNPNANIFALDDLTIARDASLAKTEKVTNYKADIRTLHGDIGIYASTLENITDTPVIKTHHTVNGNTQVWDDYIESRERIAQILSGNDLTIEADRMVNRYSLVSSAKDSRIDTHTLENKAVDLAKKTQIRKVAWVPYKDCLISWFGGIFCRKKYKTVVSYDRTSVVTDTVPSTIQAGGSIKGDILKLNNAGVKASQPVPSSTTVTRDATSTSYIDPVTRQPIVVLPNDKESLFVRTTSPDASYLIETNPEFAIYENFISSDYMMQHIRYDALATSKRLGDALYENTLVRESVFAQSGRRFLNREIKTDRQQYKYLMDNAIAASKDLHLVPGIALTKAQINALTRDIVWIEEKEVGGEKVLMPVVYLANAKHLKLQGAQIVAANDLQLNTVVLHNSGAIASGNDLAVTATESITNHGGVLHAVQDLSLEADGEITNTSAKIEAKNVRLVSKQGGIANQRYAKSVSYGRGDTVDNKILTGDAATITASDTLDIRVAEDFANRGSRLSAKALSVEADRIEVTTTQKSRSLFGGDGKNYIKDESTVHLASALKADTIRLSSKGTTTIHGAALDAKDTLEISAKKVEVSAVNDTRYSETHSTSRGFLSSSEERSISLSQKVQGSKLAAAHIVIESNGDIDLEAAGIDAGSTLALRSSHGDVNLLAKAYTSAHFHESKKSSFGGLSRSHAIDAVSRTKLAGSAVSVKSTITVGGKDIKVIASNLKSKGGTVVLDAKNNINISAGRESSSEQHFKEKKGLSFALKGGKFTYASISKDSSSDTKRTNRASHVDAKSIILKSGTDTNIIASNLKAENIAVDAKNDFNLIAAKNTSDTVREHSRKDLGMEVVLNAKEASIFTGYWEKKDGKTTTQNSVAKSTLSARRLGVRTTNANIVGSDLVAGDIYIDSKNTKVLSATAAIDTKAYSKSIKSGAKVGVTQHIGGAIKSLQHIADAKSTTGIASRALKAYDTVNSFLQKPVDAGLYALHEEHRSSTDTHAEYSVASNLYAGNNAVLHTQEKIEVGGSDIYANDMDMRAKEINLHAETAKYASATSSGTKNAQVSLYGSDMGTLVFGIQKSFDGLEGNTHTSTHVTVFNKASITSTQNTVLKGANIDAKELTLQVDGDLHMQSLQDTEHLTGSSKGGSISGNLMPTGASFNSGKTKGDKAWVSQMTGINGSEHIKVTVGGTTTLKGASITNIDANGIDKGNLEFTTQSLAASDIEDVDTFKSTTAGVGIGSKEGAPSLNSVSYTNNTKDKAQITKATIGKGTINTQSTTGELNRDIANMQTITKEKSSNTELYASDKSLALATNPSGEINRLKQNLSDVGLAAHIEILNNLPSVSKGKDGKGDVIDNSVGRVLDVLGDYTGGVIPNVSKDGGYITQIATQLFGDNRNIIVVKDRDKLIGIGINPNDIKEVRKKDPITGKTITVYITDPDKTVRIDEETREDDPLGEHKIYVSSDDIKSMGLEHLFTNGMFNDTDTAIVNQQTQQGYADGVLNYNQQHGIVGDMIQNIQDHLTSNLGLGSLGTGSAYQTGKIIEQMTNLNNGHLVIGAHSQGTMMTQNGLDQHRENLSAIVKANTNSIFQVQYSGAPVNYHVGADMVTSIYGGKEGIQAHMGEEAEIDSVFRSQVAPQDFVGTVLGGQSAGVNNSENLGANIIGGLAGFPLLFGVGGGSPHSYYPCIIGCGDERSTPTKNYFYENNNPDNQEVPLTDDYTRRLPHVNQGLLPQGMQIQRNAPQTQLDTIGGK